MALEGLAIAVNLSLDIPGLTLAQIKGIYTGQITNWNQVGGPDLAITPYSRRPEDGGTVEFFVDNLLTGENFSSNVQFVFNTTEALRQLASNPGGIYYAYCTGGSSAMYNQAPTTGSSGKSICTSLSVALCSPFELS